MANAAPHGQFNPFSGSRTVERRYELERAVRPISPAQIRAARAMLDWSMTDLANKARISISTVKRFETSSLQFVSAEAVAMMQDAAETEGVCFLPDDGHGPGVRFRRR